MLEASVSAPSVGAREGPWRPFSVWFSTGRFCSPGNIWSSQLGKGCYWHLVSRCWGCPDSPPQQRLTLPQMSIVPRLRKPALGQGHDFSLAEGCLRSRLMKCLPKCRGFPMQCQELGHVVFISRLSCLSRKKMKFPGWSWLPSPFLLPSLSMPILWTEVVHGSQKQGSRGPRAGPISWSWHNCPSRRVEPQSSLLCCYYLEGKVTAF